MSKKSNRLWLAAALLIAVTIGVITATARVRDITSDPRLSLLVSQTIIQKGTIKFDSYVEMPKFPMGNVIQEKNGHYYYLFPLGTPLFSLPFVWAANLFGKDMFFYEWHTQIAIASVLNAAIFIVLYLMARCYLSGAASLAIVSVSYLGSSLMSTMGTALWSHNFTTLFISLSLLLIARKESGKTDSLNPYLLGFFLFAAYLCRPNASVLIPPVLAYAFFRERRIFFKLTATVAALFAIFIVYSFVEVGSALPFYYRGPGAFSFDVFFLAVYGNLLSPSRGILPFSPFFLLTVIGAVLYFGRLKRNAFFWVASAWYILNLASISPYVKWYGGWCYGSRYQTEAIPGLIAVTVLLWSAAAESAKRTAIAAAFIILGAGGIYFNTVQGLYNPMVQAWNAIPNVAEHEEYLFDWRYPQFLSSERMLSRRLAEFKSSGGNQGRN